MHQKSWQQAVLRHAGHVLLDDGLQFVFHRLLIGAAAYEVVLHQRVGEGIDGAGALAVELEHMAMLDVLVDAVEIVDGPGIFGRGLAAPESVCLLSISFR